MERKMKLKEIKKKYRTELRKKANVKAIGIGKKIIAGKISEELCIRVYVEKKIAKSRIKEEDLIPETLDGYKTDVIEIGIIRFQGVRDRNRPTKGGDSLGSCHSLAYGYIMAGTLGSALLDKVDGNRVLLSNNHVIANMDNDVENRANNGDLIVQPGTLDGGSCNNDVIGTLKRWIQFTNGDNEIDAAIADINNINDASECNIGCDIGRIQGLRELTDDDIDLSVQKCGRTTEYTTGTVVDTDVDVWVDYEVLIPGGIEIRSYLFIDQIFFTAMSDIGDSGSLILDNNNKAVALLFAGSDTITAGNKIKKVLDLMNLELCPPRVFHCLPGRPDRKFRCLLGGPDKTLGCLHCGPNSEILCRISGPCDTIRCHPGGPREIIPCLLGRPNQIIQCVTGRPDSLNIDPICLACGPDSDIGCGTGGPRDIVEVFRCGIGPKTFINPKDPFIDPKKLVILNLENIPKDMQASLKKMLKKISEEK